MAHQSQHQAEGDTRAKRDDPKTASRGGGTAAGPHAQLLALQRSAGNGAVSALVAGRAGAGLPPGLKSGVESVSGISMDGVRVHYDSPRPRRVSALAFTEGSDIHLASGQERHLPHEAWHAVQQA